MRTREKSLDREIRIELLRAQAALERGELCRHMRHLRDDIRPGNLFQSFSGARQGSTFSRLSGLLLSSTQRYPMLISVLSAVVGGVGGKGMKAGALGLIGWRLAKLFLLRSARKTNATSRSGRVIEPYQ